MASFQAVTTPAAAITSHQGCGNESSTNGSGGCTNDGVASFKAAETVIELASMFKEKPDPSNLVFGTVFTDHMLTIEWSASDGWQKPHIGPFKNLSVHPASSALHYAVELFEGLKAYRGVDNNIRLFRPLNNMERMRRSACRAGLPPSLGVKKPSRALLYVILSPVGPYFSTGGFSPVSLWADPKYTRAWRGGTGDCKMGGNYGASIFAQYEAMEVGCQQVLWLYGDNHQITEVGTMNLFLYWINENGDEELATPPLDGVILPGVTRQSIIDIAHKWGEFKVTERYLTMGDLIAALKENRVKEMFGAGTACVVCPVGRILYKGNNLHIPTMDNGPKLTARILKQLTDIQYGRIESDWTYLVQ
ncbi:branched-chain-amino-acid aminotransferase, cytosolic-like isoform X2 [Polyodon spathula]|uniref:branched-chain-amino-acid aminotransferase, cytosolic-like isoform X2 n=1 Tax=Polyodon spathula TaxID=7913 RepID=UPI001B7E5B93|nr:branched-chain-amino-acid aminotransferase, cytosolic-like isoform X2 [Polyodon spathula]